MASFFGLKRLSASVIFFTHKKEQSPIPSQQQQQQQQKRKKQQQQQQQQTKQKQKRLLSVRDAPRRQGIDYHSRVYDHDLATKFGDNVMVNDLELLLSMETQARMEAIEARERRSRNLRFSLPPPPLRPTNSCPPPSPLQQPSHSGRWDQWRRRSTGSISAIIHRWGSVASAASTEMSLSSQEQHKPLPEIGLSSRVQLIRRPLPTYGIVRFIGSVDFAPGEEWIGVELDSRVGRNDGSVKGIRYFDTVRDRGIFVFREDLVPLIEDDSTSESDIYA